MSWAGGPRSKSGNRLERPASGMDFLKEEDGKKLVNEKGVTSGIDTGAHGHDAIPEATNGVATNGTVTSGNIPSGAIMSGTIHKDTVTNGAPTNGSANGAAIREKVLRTTTA